MRIARTRLGRIPADQAMSTTMTIRIGSTHGGSRNAANSTQPSASSFVSGFRRCNQLSPGR